MPIYNGSDTRLHAVTIDYEKEGVLFRAIGKESHIMNIFSILTNFFIGHLLLLISFLVFISFIEPNIIDTLYSIGIRIIILGTVYTLLLYANKKWRTTVFPKKVTRLFWFIPIHRTRIITPEQLQGKVHLIPKFQNMILEWKASGDMATQLTKVHINEHFKDKGDAFWAQFTFKEIPRNGELHLKYV